MTVEGSDPNESVEWDAVHEIEIAAPIDPPSRSTARIAVAGAAMVGALLAGAYFVASEDQPTEVASEQTSDDDAVVDEAVADETIVDTPDDESDSTAEATSSASSGDAEFAADHAQASAYYGGPGTVFATDDGFAAIAYHEDGMTIDRSSDGLDWSSSPTNGLPQNGNLTSVVAYDGGWVGLFQEWPEPGEDVSEIDEMFGFELGPKMSIATTPDLTTWTLSPIPELDTSDASVFVSVNRLAAAGDRVVAIVERHPQGPDEMRILFEAGLITEQDLSNFCGSEVSGPDEPIVVYSCDHEEMEEVHIEFEEAMAAADSDEERARIEEEFTAAMEAQQPPEQDVLVTIEPGTPVHDAIIESYQFEYEPMSPEVLSGPVGGPYTLTTLPAAGYPGGLASVDGEFVAAVQDFSSRQPSTIVLGSANGSDWDVRATIDGDGLHELAVAGSTLVATGSSSTDGSMVLRTSTDRGATWVDADLGSDLYGGYAQVISGPAGTAIKVMGAIEPYPVFEPPIIEIVNDGFTLIMNEGSPDAWVTLVDASGATVHEVTFEQLEQSDNFGALEIEGVMRADERSGAMTFLDPDSGEDLVTFTEEMFEEAYSDVYPDDDFDFEEPDTRSELYFSTDGVTWKLLDGVDLGSGYEGETQLMAVGDDEILLFDYSFRSSGDTSQWIRIPID
ncbi:MAG: hypothetical protein ACR2P0_11025 [Acidimicrobiales bacterium]